MPRTKATPHTNPQGPITKAILLPGDPLRAKFIAETCLEDAQQFSSVRNMFGFTGYYQGTQVSVMGLGIGIPSISLYAWELTHIYGYRKLIRIGTCGSLQPEVSVFDVVITQTACSNPNFINQYNPSGTYAPTGSFRLTEAVHGRTRANGVISHVGDVLSSDTFYNADPSFNDRWAKMGIIAVEMETTGLYTTAADAGVGALGTFIVSDSLVTGEVVMVRQRQTAFTDMMGLAPSLAQI